MHPKEHRNAAAEKVSLRPRFLFAAIHHAYTVSSAWTKERSLLVTSLLLAWVLVAWVPVAGWAGVPVETPTEMDALRAEQNRLLRLLAANDLETPYIVIDTRDNRLQLRSSDGELMRDAVCATGAARKFEGTKAREKWHFATPKGRFAVLHKTQDPIWIKPVWHFIEVNEEVPVFAEDRRRFQRGVLGEYALYFAKGYMIHGTLYEVNLGNSITHGCVRLGADDLGYLYNQVQRGWPVYIY
jgi:L,D-transpeptidase YbiS